MLAVQGTFNRTAYGIETGEVQVFRQFDTILLIAPLMELKHDKQTRGCWRFKELLIAPLMELKKRLSVNSPFR